MGVVTTIIVGAISTAIGSYFQRMSWNHQNEVKTKDSEKDKATKLFDTISSEMDTRLFSMRQVFWGIESTSVSEEEVKSRWADYRQILKHWNNSLNRNLSMVERYFGDKARQIFEEQIQKGFIDLGSELGKYYHNVNKRKDFNKIKFNHRADELNELIRSINIAMIEEIQEGRVGIFHPEVQRG